jgi:hypothetical protein
MQRIHYTQSQFDDNFARFRPPDLIAWPLDFMFVDQETFTRLYSASETAVVGVAEVKVVSARHLFLLKLHAMRQQQDCRFSKNFGDAVALLRSGKTGIENRHDLLALCTRYASRGIYDKLEVELGE